MMVAALKQSFTSAVRFCKRCATSMRLHAQLAGLEQDIADLDDTLELAGELSDVAPLLRFERRQMVSKAQALRAEIRALQDDKQPRTTT